MLGVIVGLLGCGMLLYLIPGQGTTTVSNDEVVAQVDDQSITSTDLRQQLARVAQNGVIPPALMPLYTQQVLNQLVFQKELGIEARQLGIKVSDQERADRIRQLIPTAFVGDGFVGIEQYAAQVQERIGMGVPEFEDLITQSLIEEKFRQLVTDGITVPPAAIEQEFRRRNEKIKISYVVIKPDELESKIEPNDADLNGYFEKNKARYNVPERRVVRYALLDFERLRSQANVPEEEIKAYYNSHLDRYKLEDRAHVAHILFKTVGKTDAEVEETRKKAEDVLKKAKSGGNFADLAKEYSEDTTKDNGGDLDWIVRGQTVPEFEKAAFTLPKGSISDLVKTQYGFHIIKVIDRETARTQTLNEVLPQILAALQQEKADKAADEVSAKIGEEIRRSGKVPLDDLAKKFNLTVGETQPIEAGQPIPEIGNAPELSETISRLRAGDQSAPIHTDRGYAIVSIKQVLPAHPGTLAEVREKVLSDYRRDKAVELAKSRAQELARHAKAGEDLVKVAKPLGFDAKTSDLFARNGTLPDVGSAAQLGPAFSLKQGEGGDAVAIGANWIVYRVLEHQQPDMQELPKQRDEISRQLLEAKREMAFEAFQKSLDARMRQNGKLRINADSLKRITSPSSS